MKHIPSTPKIFPPCNAISIWYLQGSTPERRYILHILTRKEAAITKSITTWSTWMAAGMSLSGCKNLDVQGCKSLAPPATALQISAARLAPYRALWHSGKLCGSNLSHISSQQAASLRRQPALFLISFNDFSLKFLCRDQRLWLDSPHILQ